jgi:hypothetical protein
LPVLIIHDDRAQRLDQKETPDTRRSQRLGSKALVDQTSVGLRSLVKQDGALELSLAQVTVSPSKDDEVIVRVETTPINPSDLGLLLAGGDVSLAKVSGKGSQTVVTPAPSPCLRRSIPMSSRPTAAERRARNS